MNPEGIFKGKLISAKYDISHRNETEICKLEWELNPTTNNVAIAVHAPIYVTDWFAMTSNTLWRMDQFIAIMLKLGVDLRTVDVPLEQVAILCAPAIGKEAILEVSYMKNAPKFYKINYLWLQ